ncbi:helix-turn-helix domain-containing protein [Sphingobacterium bovistauri]|uniref:Helix-turn-helix transcriptional regulator n=1 Tax=Sphingobacterium bovistauri TaxID=2781959 RepID=A0ABS7Z3Z8_9SPHI|nr:AraC family transcriptional regulator [Sphingobacterium bovistauri]MCA5004911.1 helix-turn-helix transcriptional regulator [Sphingobacterium bovistauri]
MKITSARLLCNRYLDFLDLHIQNVIDQIDEEFLEINQIAKKLNISHVHLTDTIQKETGHHPCYFYDLKIIEVAKQLLHNKNNSIADVARILTYDPSNFSKFFKKFTQTTPGQYRKISLK